MKKSNFLDKYVWHANVACLQINTGRNLLGNFSHVGSLNSFDPTKLKLWLAMRESMWYKFALPPSGFQVAFIFIATIVDFVSIHLIVSVWREHYSLSFLHGKIRANENPHLWKGQVFVLPPGCACRGSERNVLRTPQPMGSIYCSCTISNVSKNPTWFTFFLNKKNVQHSYFANSQQPIKSNIEPTGHSHDFQPRPLQQFCIEKSFSCLGNFCLSLLT